jgi:hypothetical protein
MSSLAENKLVTKFCHLADQQDKHGKISDPRESEYGPLSELAAISAQCIECLAPVAWSADLAQLRQRSPQLRQYAA